jgi:pimeloyl-ACP methyl ester carboxylesterase
MATSTQVTAGTIEYREVGDPDGKPVVLLHGLLMNDYVWNDVLPLLPEGHRYVLPVLPLGGHRVPMRDDADLTLPAMVGLVADFLDALDLVDVTLVVSDWGGPLFLTDLGRDKRVARMVVCPSEAYDNFPPGLPGKMVWLATRTTWTVKLALQQMRIDALRNRFFMWGMMTAKPIPRHVMETWTAPAIADVRIRRDLLKYANTTFVKSELVRATKRLADFPGDVLVLWSRNHVMPVAHAEALAELTGGTVRYIDDAKVMVMMDQPEQTAHALGEFLLAEAGDQSSSS